MGTPEKSPTSVRSTQQTFNAYGIGETVKVRGVRGEFTVTGVNKDGSIAVYGGTIGRERFRSFDHDLIVPMRRKRNSK